MSNNLKITTPKFLEMMNKIVVVDNSIWTKEAFGELDLDGGTKAKGFKN